MMSVRIEFAPDKYDQNDHKTVGLNGSMSARGIHRPRKDKYQRKFKY